VALIGAAQQKADLFIEAVGGGRVGFCHTAGSFALMFDSTML
jgi:hypothetical protein